MKKNSTIWLSLLILLLITSFMPVKLARSQTTTLLVHPTATQDEDLISGTSFTVYINISDVEDLYLVQTTIMWNASMLELEGPGSLAIGDFGILFPLPLFEMNNTEGWAMIGLSKTGMVPGESGSGCLYSITFEVEDYGYTAIAFDNGTYRDTFLLNSWYGLIPFTQVDGHFRNKLVGDVDGDGDVDWEDFGDFALAYGSKGPPQVPTPDPDYNLQADLDLDGDVDWEDFGDFALNYGRP